MNMMDIRRRMLESISSGLSVTSVSTSAHTAVSIASLTWEELSLYSKAISADSGNTYSNSIRSVTFSDGATLGVGDYLNIAINSVNYRVDIIGFHHDEVTDSATYGGDYAGITWQMHYSHSTKYQMNTMSTNSGGWNGCLMRTSTMPMFLGYLTSDLSGVIVPVNKLTSSGLQSSTIITSSDSLFLLSEIEVFGSRTGSAAGEGIRYSYYAAGNSTAKTEPDASPSTPWERSPWLNSNDSFCSINTGGGASGTIASSTSRDVAFAFCT